MIYSCCQELRREAVRAHPTLNGIDSLEVLDRDAPPGSPRQRTLMLRLLKPAPALTEDNVEILGGERITPVRVEWVAVASSVTAPDATPEEIAFFGALPDRGQVLIIRTDSSGDYSTYMLRLVVSAVNATPPADFDPPLSRVSFSFKVECPSDFDCAPQHLCPETAPVEPDIDYLAKDYASLRRLMLDRMAAIMPQWRERSPADIGVALVELLAYVGDHLSYRQDAVATEAYLGTARKRVSVRRHARLVDYPMHDGCNARAWVQIEVEADKVALAEGTALLTRVPDQAPVIPLPNASERFDDAMRHNPVIFETMRAAILFAAHNSLSFYTWADRECCIAKGATRATLRGNLPNLLPGEILIFEEVRGPRTGAPEDADRTRRHPVRLLEVVSQDEAAAPLTDPLTGEEITEIRWAQDDALPFPICVSAVTDPDHGSLYIEDVSVARGNIVPADHGRTLEGEPLGIVPEPHLFNAPAEEGGRCDRRSAVPVPPRFRPALAAGPLTQPGAFDPDASARSFTHRDLADAVPAIALVGTFEGEDEVWTARRDLLRSAGDAPEFVIESETDGTALVRFGDDRHGARPQSGTEFRATYRVGNGRAGNIGADSLAHIVTDAAGIVAVRNPIPAQGGTEPESIEDVRARAPYAFRTQERAVTPDDYAEVTRRHDEVQRAAATFRWTGSWHTVFVTVDRARGLAVDPSFEDEMRRHIEPFRMAGYDLEIDDPRFVPLEIDLQVCVKPNYFRADVRRALLDQFSNRTLADGRRGLFHPDNFTFGQPVYASHVYALAQSVPGVESATITKFQRQGVADLKPLDTGELTFGRLEIGRLDNDSSFPERGVFRLQLGGGK